MRDLEGPGLNIRPEVGRVRVGCLGAGWRVVECVRAAWVRRGRSVGMECGGMRVEVGAHRVGM